MHRYLENIAVLVVGVLIAAIGVFPVASGNIFRNGAPAVVAAFMIAKGASSLRCKASDVVLSAIAFVLVLLSKLVPAHAISPVVFHVVALAILPIFAMTGLTFKAMATERKRRKESEGH